jgi:TatD DNase family protein
MKFPAKKQQEPDHVYAYPMGGNCYLNISNRCNLRCRFCPRIKSKWKVRDYNLCPTEGPSAGRSLAAVISAGNPGDFREVVFSGSGEPTLRLGTLLTLGQELRRLGARVRLNTNGLANHSYGYDVTPLLAGAVDAVSIALNAQDETTYQQLCRPIKAGAYGSLLDFIPRIRKHIHDVRLTAIDGLPGVDIKACARIADELGVKFQAKALKPEA